MLVIRENLHVVNDPNTMKNELEEVIPLFS
jgi:hypothetical protein